MELDILKKITQPVFFVTNDVGRGIGLENVLPNYHIVCLDDHPLVDILEKSGVSVFCLERAVGKKNILRRSSGLILEQSPVLSFIEEKAGDQTPNILFFKPQKKIEILAKKLGFNLIGNSSELNRSLEDKIHFFRLAGGDVLFPPSEVVDLAKLDFSQTVSKYGLPFVIQFGSGWAGNSTFFITASSEMEVIKKKYFFRKIKISKFINGFTVLNNAVIFQDKIIKSLPALQIKADPVLTANRGGTGGRQWPAKISSLQNDKVDRITEKIGGLMRQKGYRGFFGLDFLIEEKTDEVYLSENNARLTASCSFYTKLELAKGIFPLMGYHLLSFLNQQPKISVETQRTDEIKGSEIVARNTDDYPVEAAGGIKPGIFDRNLRFKKEAYHMESISNEDFWLTTVDCGRKINPEIEIIRINTFAEVCDNTGVLKNNYLKIIQDVRRLLKLKKW